MKSLPNYFYPTSNQSDKFIVYALLEPISEEIRYIGKSCSGLHRIRQHFGPSQLKAKNKKSNWLKSLIKKNIFPKLKILEVATDKINLSELEKKHILIYKSGRLLNMTAGGDGNGYIRSTRSSPPNKGKKASTSAKLKMSAARLGRSFKPRTIEEKNKISQANITAHSSSAKPFICIQNNKVYRSQREAAIELKLNPANISGVLNGHKKTTNGFSFKFL